MASFQRHNAPGCTTLPHELILLILSKLPIELLLRFKSVSKQWCSLMTHPSLVDAHRKAHSQRTLFLSYHVRGYDHASQLHMLDHELKLRSIPVAYPGGKFCIAGSCNGFVCITSTRIWSSILDPIIVCNPITRESMVLPQVQYTSDCGYSFEMRMGFAFSPSSMEYKVLRIIHSLRVMNPRPRNRDEFQNRSIQVSQMLRSNTNRCEVITLGSGMEWRELSVPSDHVLSYGGNLLAVDGKMYWFAEDEAWIVSFDIGNETFQLMQSPLNADDENNNRQLVHLVLENLGSRLALAKGEAETETLRLWFLVDARKNVWTEMYSISMNCLLMHAQLSCQVHQIGEHVVPLLKIKEIFESVQLISLHAMTKDNSTTFAICIGEYDPNDEETWKAELEFDGIPVEWITIDYVPTLASLDDIINHGY